MKKINSKFELNQTVWFMKQNKALSSTIRSAQLWTEESTEEDKYNLTGYGWYKASGLYSSKEELFQGILNG